MASQAVKRFRPLMDRVLVQAVKQETKTASGLYLPETTKSAINQATVRQGLVATELKLTHILL